MELEGGEESGQRAVYLVKLSCWGQQVSDTREKSFYLIL